MRAEQLVKNILNLDARIRFVGVMEKSGHLYVSVTKDGLQQYLSGRNPEISMSQSVYIVDLRKMFVGELGSLQSIVYIHDKVKIFSMPIKEHVLAVSTESMVNVDELVEKITRYVKSVEGELSLYPPSNVVDPEKKESLRNLLESGISEDLIAEQLDLDVSTVQAIVHEIRG
jgi:hypothetical protein